MQIADERRERLIERHVIVLYAAWNGAAGVTVMVPASYTNRDNPRTRLDESPRQEQALAELMLPISLPHSLAFLAGVERFVGRRARKHLQCLPLQLVDRVHRLP